MKEKVYIDKSQPPYHTLTITTTIIPQLYISTTSQRYYTSK